MEKAVKQDGNAALAKGLRDRAASVELVDAKTAMLMRMAANRIEAMAKALGQS